jgi:hypothetical protein
MSAEALAAVLNHSHARGTTKMVLVAIAWHTNENPELGCWPSQETLARYANTTIRTVQRSLDHLVELGEIETEIHGGLSYSGAATTNRYFIRLDCPQGCDGTLWHRDLSTGDLAIGDILDVNRRHS